jgi:hypothetical protein
MAAISVRVHDFLLERCAVIHQRVVPCARIIPFKRFLDSLKEFTIGYAGFVAVEEVQIDGADIGLDKSVGQAKREGRDRGSRIFADARKLFKLSRGFWKDACVFVDDTFTGLLQVARATVIAKPYPFFKHSRERRFRESVN